MPNETQPHKEVDLVVQPEWVIPIQPPGIVLSGHSVVVDQGKIIGLFTHADAARLFRAKTVKKLPGQVLMPGLVNLHCHAAMTLLRGYADDLPLKQWLENHIWPAEARHAVPEFVRTGSLLACFEMLRGGITCFNDMYFFPEETAEAALFTGIRASLGLVVIDFPTRYAADVSDYLAKGMALREKYRHNELLSFCLAPHAPYTVGDQSFERIATVANDTRMPVHIHAHETAEEIANDVTQYGERPIERLLRLGLLSQKTILAHAVHLTNEELELLAKTGTHIAHCPTSNLKLGSGIANSNAWLDQELNFGLGTDGAASNNRADIWQEVRLASLMAKGSSENAASFTSHQALFAATLGGAKALGLDSRIGSIEPGKDADLIAIKLDDWLCQPCYDPASHLVFVTGREQVSHVWIKGAPKVKDGQFPGHDMHQLLAEVRAWQTRIAAKT